VGWFDGLFGWLVGLAWWDVWLIGCLGLMGCLVGLAWWAIWLVGCLNLWVHATKGSITLGDQPYQPKEVITGCS
jgi:hypothetical protein